MHKFLAVIFIWLLWPATLNAKGFTNRGMGTTSCGSWTQEQKYKTATAALQESWVLGFVTAMEFQAPTKNYHSPDNFALIAWISNYCAKSPLDNLVQAAFGLTLELRKDDPADLERAKDVIRTVLRRKCSEGDSDACKSLEKLN